MISLLSKTFYQLQFNIHHTCIYQSKLKFRLKFRLVMLLCMTIKWWVVTLSPHFCTCHFSIEGNYSEKKILCENLKVILKWLIVRLLEWKPHYSRKARIRACNLVILQKDLKKNTRRTNKNTEQNMIKDFTLFYRIVRITLYLSDHYSCEIGSVSYRDWIATKTPKIVSSRMRRRALLAPLLFHYDVDRMLLNNRSTQFIKENNNPFAVLN